MFILQFTFYKMDVYLCFPLDVTVQQDIHFTLGKLKALNGMLPTGRTELFDIPPNAVHLHYWAVPLLFVRYQHLSGLSDFDCILYNCSYFEVPRVISSGSCPEHHPQSYPNVIFRDIWWALSVIAGTWASMLRGYMQRSLIAATTLVIVI